MLQILWLQDLKTKNGSKLKQKSRKNFSKLTFCGQFLSINPKEREEEKKTEKYQKSSE